MEDLDRAGFEALSAGDRLRWLAGWALLAPTTHNTVPQRFALDEARDALGVWVDRAAILAESDPTGRQATVSLGCVVENAVLAAASVGRVAQVELDVEAAIRPGADVLVPVAELRFREGDVEPGRWSDAMRRRKVVRAAYDARVALPEALGAELRDRVTRLHPGLTLHLVGDAAGKHALGKLQELADSTVINREPFARELGAWLVPNDSASPVGMRGREFGLGDAAAERLHRGLRGEVRLLPDEIAGFAKAGSAGMRSASAVAVITAARDDLEHRFAAGRALEQAALRLVQEGFAIAVHAGLSEVEGPNRALQSRLRTRQRPTAIFRIGVPLRPEDGARPRSTRPPLEAVLVPR